MEAQQEPLPYEVRVVGETFRRYGALQVRSGSKAAEWMLNDLLSGARAARERAGDAKLLQLRALELNLFLAAMHRFEVEGISSVDLTELGGEFVGQATKRGWLRPEAHPSDDELAVLFGIRWNTLLGLLETYPFSPSLNDWRAYYGFLLRADHPADLQNERDFVGYRLNLVAALSKRDPDYPLLLARGILLYQFSDYSGAAEDLRGFLLKHRSGPWQLRAINTFLASTAKLSG